MNHHQLAEICVPRMPKLLRQAAILENVLYLDLVEAIVTRQPWERIDRLARLRQQAARRFFRRKD